MNASHQNNALEHEKLLAALEICKKTHVQTDWSKLQGELASAKDYIQHSESQKAELDARILALETDINSRVWSMI
jgi:septal ring factor EnvC (AmiA/AmiB activator)